MSVTELELDTFYAKCKQRLIDKGIANADEIRGLSDGDIEDLISCFPHPMHLPFSYIQFLRHFGRGAGKFWSTEYWTYPTVLRNPESFHWIWNVMGYSRDKPAINQNSFIFLNSEAICFWYFYSVFDFRILENSSYSEHHEFIKTIDYDIDDPTVHFWHERMDSMGVIASSTFTEFVRNAIEDRMSMVPKLKE